MDALQAGYALENLRQKALDLQRAQRQFKTEARIYSQFSLYFLEIDLPGQIIYKVGITSRPPKQRMQEIDRDLHSIEGRRRNVLFFSPGMACLEGFLKFQYRDQRFIWEKHTEYFQFTSDIARKITSELRSLPYLDKV